MGVGLEVVASLVGLGVVVGVVIGCVQVFLDWKRRSRSQRDRAGSLRPRI